MIEPDIASGTLAQLGFNETEALTYCELLRNPGRTGYSVAKTLRKSQANVYGALASLAAKGAVDFSNSAVRLYQAVPPDELLPRLSKDFAQKCKVAESALSRVSTSTAEDRVYQLKHPDQVFERAAAMCSRAKESIAFELFPIPFEHLREELGTAAGRGVGVAGVTFEPGHKIDGVTCALSAKVGRRSAWPQASAWPRDHMAVVVDAREALVALFDRESHEVLHGLYTDSVYISCLLHAGIVDAVVVNLERSKVARTSINKKLFGIVPSGFLELIGREQFQDSGAGPAAANGNRTAGAKPSEG